MIPTRWVKLPSYNDPCYDPVWAAAAATGLPVHTHSGVGPDDYGYTPGLISIYTTEAYWWAARPLWCADPRRGLRAAPGAEVRASPRTAPGGCPTSSSRMDTKWEGDHATRKFGPAVFRSGLTMKPGEYFNRNCWIAASVMGPAEIERRYQIGVDNLMWGSDYPHPEGTWPQHQGVAGRAVPRRARRRRPGASSGSPRPSSTTSTWRRSPRTWSGPGLLVSDITATAEA